MEGGIWFLHRGRPDFHCAVPSHYALFTQLLTPLHLLGSSTGQAPGDNSDVYLRVSQSDQLTSQSLADVCNSL